MRIFKKFKRLLKLNIKTIWFNFHYLPFKQAIKFPILLNNANLIKTKGKIIIESKEVYFGMIKLGRRINTLYGKGNEGINWEHRGVCIFRGEIIIGSGSAISTGKKGVLEFGDNVIVGVFGRIACYKNIKIGDNSRIAWENIIIDTDFHETVNIKTGARSEMTKEISIGANNWIGIRTIVLKGTQTPDFCIVGANSLINKKYDLPTYSLIAGSPAKLVAENVYRDLDSFEETD